MAKVNASTQQFVEIKEIRDSVVYLKKGGLRQILMVSGINFDLKSEVEPFSKFLEWTGFLNSIFYPLAKSQHQPIFGNYQRKKNSRTKRIIKNSNRRIYGIYQVICRRKCYR